MKRIICLNPAISSTNKGDEIIVEACTKHLENVLNDSFAVHVSTHMPMVNYQIRAYGKVDYTIVLGSNLLCGILNQEFRQWYLRGRNILALSNVVLMGAGWQQYNGKINFYTKEYYRMMFKGPFIHSVRDEYTKNILNSIGITNVINTGCPTMWGFTKDFCADIPTSKHKDVVFTLTDYAPNPKRDKYLIDCLKKNYENLYFWIQGMDDLDYLESLTKGHDEKIEYITWSLEAYEEFLKTHDCDYVGTRLHAGIKAIQMKKRTLIIGIDNRAIELNRDSNLNVLNADEIEKLEEKINGEIVTDIHINEKNIEEWKSQFKK